MKNKKYFYPILHKIAFLVTILCFVFAILKKCEIFLFITIIGIVLLVFLNPYKTIYLCPKCGANFECKDKIILTTGFKSIMYRSLLTCPKCKKIRFCRSKSVLDYEKIKIEDKIRRKK